MKSTEHDGCPVFVISLAHAQRRRDVISARLGELGLSCEFRDGVDGHTMPGMTWLTGLKTPAVIPSPVLRNDAIPSCIDEQDNHERWYKCTRLPFWQRLLYPLTRGIWKFYVNCYAKVAYICTWASDRRLWRKHGKPLIPGQ